MTESMAIQKEGYARCRRLTKCFLAQRRHNFRRDTMVPWNLSRSHRPIPSTV